MSQTIRGSRRGPGQAAPSGVSRRGFLRNTAGGFGALALQWLAMNDATAATHHRPKATRVIQLFMLGGASQCDTFDYKPELIRRHGETVPFTITGGTATSPGPVLKSPWNWAQHGETGRWVTDAMPHLAGRVDDLAFLYSMHAPTSEHSAAQTMQGSGFVTPGFPSIGSWVSYALGRESDDLPAFVALPDPVGLPWTGKAAWSNGFLPAGHQGVMFNPSAADPVPDLFASRDAKFITPDEEREGRGDLDALNRLQAAAAPDDSRLEARIAGYEMAARMQLAVPDVLAVRGESDATRALYGLDDPLTEPIGRNCLIARRMIERGVRFVQVWCGSGLNGASQNWDNHSDITRGSDFERMCVRSDRPVAGLLTDLKARGLLDETVVLWTTEFGRTPYSQGGKGRDHNGNAFTSWMAGGGIKAGASFGQSDEFSFHAAVDPIMCYDQHATLLHLLGVDHERLTVRHNGADRRLTDVHGKVIREILA